MAKQSFVRTGGGLAGLILLLAILIAANVIVGNLRMRADLTEEKLYTLSDGTRAFLSTLEGPVTLKYFFSESSAEVPVHLKTYAQQVEDLLHEYALASGHKLRLEKYDPKPDSDAEEAAMRYGITGRPTGMFGPPVYFGLVASAGKTEGTIPAFDPQTEKLLEYNVTRLIYRVTNPEKPVVGVMSSHQVLGEQPPQQYGMMPPARPTPPWLAFRELQQDYTLRPVDTSAESIPDDIHTLILVHAKELSDKTQYAIDQFVLRGGKLLVLLDPMNVADLESVPQQPFGPPSASSELGRLLAAWGVTYDSGKVLADMKAASRLRGGNGQIEESPLFLTLRAANVNPDDILTANLDMIMLPFAGSFTAESTDALTVTPLITSSDMAGSVSAMTAQMGSAAFNREFKPERAPQDIAIRISGTFKSAFPDGAPTDPAAEDADSEAPSPDDEGLTEGKSTVILVADADMVYDRFCVESIGFLNAIRLVNDNLSFFANAVEQLAGSEALIGIRSRGDFARPFDRVLELEQEARRQWQEKEKALVEKLTQTRSKLQELQASKSDGQRFILSREQEAALKGFREEEARINRELKDVRKNLRQDIERLGIKVKVINIVLIPLLVAIVGIVIGVRRHSS